VAAVIAAVPHVGDVTGSSAPIATYAYPDIAPVALPALKDTVFPVFGFTAAVVVATTPPVAVTPVVVVVPTPPVPTTVETPVAPPSVAGTVPVFVPTVEAPPPGTT
jgi:hypothetical protein